MFSSAFTIIQNLPLNHEAPSLAVASSDIGSLLVSSAMALLNGLTVTVHVENTRGPGGSLKSCLQCPWSSSFHPRKMEASIVGLDLLVTCDDFRTAQPLTL